MLFFHPKIQRTDDLMWLTMVNSQNVPKSFDAHRNAINDNLKTLIAQSIEENGEEYTFETIETYCYESPTVYQGDALTCAFAAIEQSDAYQGVISELRQNWLEVNGSEVVADVEDFNEEDEAVAMYADNFNELTFERFLELLEGF